MNNQINNDRNNNLNAITTTRGDIQGTQNRLAYGKVVEYNVNTKHTKDALMRFSLIMGAWRELDDLCKRICCRSLKMTLDDIPENLRSPQGIVAHYQNNLKLCKDTEREMRTTFLYAGNIKKDLKGEIAILREVNRSALPILSNFVFDQTHDKQTNQADQANQAKQVSQVKQVNQPRQSNQIKQINQNRQGDRGNQNRRSRLALETQSGFSAPTSLQPRDVTHVDIEI